MFSFRPYREGDEPGVYDVCLKTGDAGHDGSHLFRDPELLGHLYVGPYMRLEPDLAFVLEDELGICGYVLGALDSERFYRRFEEEWLPPLRKKYPVESGADPIRAKRREERLKNSLLRDGEIIGLLHRPPVYYPESFRAWPSHMHIDLVERAQGKGWGRKMVEHLLTALRAKGSKGVHLGMNVRNERAGRFYRKLGFEEVGRLGGTVYMGKGLLTAGHSSS